MMSPCEPLRAEKMPLRYVAPQHIFESHTSDSRGLSVDAGTQSSPTEARNRG